MAAYARVPKGESSNVPNSSPGCFRPSPPSGAFQAACYGQGQGVFGSILQDCRGTAVQSEVFHGSCCGKDWHKPDASEPKTARVDRSVHARLYPRETVGRSPLSSVGVSANPIHRTVRGLQEQFTFLPGLSGEVRNNAVGFPSEGITREATDVAEDVGSSYGPTTA